jgi:prephenate dehydrogenase
VRIGKLVVVGVGLIGGSCALALKARGAVAQVVGIGRTRANLDDATRCGVVDRAMTLDQAWTRELRDADMVLVAAPVAQYPALFAAIAPAIGPRTVVTDAGSTKQDVVAAARASFGEALPRFVPAHPIAGTENSGAASAFATLYDGRTVILTPIPDTDRAAEAAVRALWEGCGAQVRTLDAARHDRIYAAVSHLPHLLAFAFVDSIAAREDAGDYLDLAGGGFRDFTRIAASAPEMWRDILLANRAAVSTELQLYRAMLDRFEAAMQQGDAAALDALIDASRRARRAWSAGRGGSTADSPVQR